MLAGVSNQVDQDLSDPLLVSSDDRVMKFWVHVELQGYLPAIALLRVYIVDETEDVIDWVLFTLEGEVVSIDCLQVNDIVNEEEQECWRDLGQLKLLEYGSLDPQIGLLLDIDLVDWLEE